LEVLIISRFDWAYSGGHIAAALRYVGIDAECYTTCDCNKFKYPHKRPDGKTVDRALETARKLIFKGDEKIPRSILSRRQPDVHLVEGTYFRRYSRACPKTACGEEPLSTYAAEIMAGTKLAAVSPDLTIGVNLPITVMQHGYPEQPYTWSYPYNTLPLHIPSDPRKKGTLKLQTQNRIEVKHNIPWQESVASKRSAPLYVDQVAIGWYGYAGIEAAAFGVPVAFYLEPQLKKHFKSIECPYLELDITGAGVDKIISRMSGSSTMAIALSRETYDWTRGYHGYKTVGEKWATYLQL